MISFFHGEIKREGANIAECAMVLKTSESIPVFVEQS